MRSFLYGSLVAAAASLAPACSPSEVPQVPVGSDRTNVVLILVDTLRADMLSSYGHPLDPSPELARLAREGVRFEHVIAQSSWTLPSVGSLLTSRYPRTLGLYVEGVQVLPRSFETLAEVLSAHGYTALGATANPNLNSLFNFDQGFERYIDSTVVFRQTRDQVPEGKIFFEDAPLLPAPAVFRSALKMIDEAGDSFPFYIQLNLMEVHEHYVSGGKRSLLRSKYRNLFSDRPEAPYLRSVRQVTDDIAEFVDELADRPGWENTLFVITSDHGEGLSDHPNVAHSKYHGRLLYASQVHVPLILFRKNWRAERQRVDSMVRLLDLAPTVLDYVGLPSPEGSEGVSLVPLMEGAAVELPEYFVSETNFRGSDKLTAYGEAWQYVHNRSPHDGLAEHELQSRASTPDGVRTDQSQMHPDETDLMRRFIAEWEERYERATPRLIERDLLENELRQLQAIGYLK